MAAMTLGVMHEDTVSKATFAVTVVESEVYEPLFLFASNGVVVSRMTASSEHANAGMSR